MKTHTNTETHILYLETTVTEDTEKQELKRNMQQVTDTDNDF